MGFDSLPVYKDCRRTVGGLLGIAQSDVIFPMDASHMPIKSGGVIGWKERREKMNDNERTVPYIVYEGTQARNERTVKRLIFALVIITVLMFASNMAWLYYWNQYDYESTATETIVGLNSDTGNANYIGNDGDIYNGEGGSN